MSRVCSICGKGKMSGHNVSHAKNRTNKTWQPNIQKVKVEENGKTKSQYVCTRCIKTMKG
jgi:large subunit ribosomal protein L28